MPIPLPKKFKADIDNNNTNVAASAIINAGNNDKVYLSTHDFWTMDESVSSEKKHFLPLLLGAPSVNESVNSEAR